jgi:4a-hydroxytetrahydrobiopterin dehydratase
MADLIGAARLDAWLQAHAWTLEGNGLQIERRFADFAAALAFVNAVGGLAEAQGHHPDIALHDYDMVRLRLWTHSAGGVTEHDLELAERIDELQ